MGTGRLAGTTATCLICPPTSTACYGSVVLALKAYSGVVRRARACALRRDDCFFFFVEVGSNERDRARSGRSLAEIPGAVVPVVSRGGIRHPTSDRSIHKAASTQRIKDTTDTRLGAHLKGSLQVTETSHRQFNLSSHSPT